MVDCLIISTGRAGSTAVYQYLNEAGKLNLPRNKEPHFWCNLASYELVDSLVQKLYVPSQHEYSQLYEASRLRIDASCGYFFYLHDVIANLRQFRQVPKVVFLFREPVSRAVSWFQERRRKGLTTAATCLADIRDAPDPGAWWEHYYDNVNYYDAFQLLNESFNDLLVVNFQQFSRDPRHVVAAILKFLEISPTHLDLVDFGPRNSTPQALVEQRLRRYRRYLPGASIIPKRVRDWGREKLVTWQAKQPAVNSDFTAEEKATLVRCLSRSLSQYQMLQHELGGQGLCRFGRGEFRCQ